MTATTLSGLDIAPLGLDHTFGAMVSGLDRGQLHDEAIRKALFDLWIDKGVILFRGESSPEMHVELSRCFGELEPHPFPESAEPGLPASIQRFLGQSLIIVGQFDKAVDALKKVPAPANLAMLAKPNEIADPVEKKTVLEYRRASLELVRAYRQSNKFADADAKLAEAMGEPAKPGWAANSVDFRKEKAFLFEAKGAAAPPAMAKQPWGEALKEWTALVGIYRTIVSKGPQPGAGGGSAYIAAQNSYYEMYLMHQRCLIKANINLLPKGDPKFVKLFDDAAKNIVNLEMINGRSFSEDTRGKFHDFIQEYPELKSAYEKQTAATLLIALQKMADRQKDVADFLAKAAAVPPPPAPLVAQMLDRAKTFNEDAAWIKEWHGKGGKMFFWTPMTN